MCETFQYKRIKFHTNFFFLPYPVLSEKSRSVVKPPNDDIKLLKLLQNTKIL